MLTYGCEVWGYSAQKIHIRRKLLSAQRQALIAITKAYRTAPTNALQVIAGLTPIHLQILQRYVNNLIIKYQAKELSTTQLHNIINRLNLPNDIQNLIRDVDDYGIDINNSNELTHPSETTTMIIHDIQDGPPKGKNFYTDGSKTANSVGAAVYFTDTLTPSHWQAVARLRDHCSIKQAESLAILRALQHINDHPQRFQHGKVNIISDSRIALLKILKHLRDNNIQIYFHWVKGNSDTNGNDQADDLARKAANITSKIHYQALPLTAVLSSLRSIIINKWQNEWDNSTTGRYRYAFIPNINQRLNNHVCHTNCESSQGYGVTLTGTSQAFWISHNHGLAQMLTAHENFRTYLNRFHNKGNAKCNCGIPEDEDPIHITFTCPNYNSQRRPFRNKADSEGLLWPCQLKDLVNNNKLFKAFKTFISNTKLSIYSNVASNTN
ncbi:uncharacterized protein LOC111615330 [Centruroides sculpturatus]|uniref:uncharacterized protein LOC111615330 n=1 Tax=Centruroides sculpturatus TaxID=218467 RepID=UPI000C6E6E3C|nr:uncharacterized protein LOC111615330 [Centruroides sculpturatus]